VRQTPVWDDLLVILIADHAYPYPYGIANSDALRHRSSWLDSVSIAAKKGRCDAASASTWSVKASITTSSAFGRFVERVRQTPVWDDLLVILIADHAYPYPYGIANSA